MQFEGPHYQMVKNIPRFAFFMSYMFYVDIWMVLSEQQMVEHTQDGGGHAAVGMILKPLNPLFLIFSTVILHS
ncbi:hypothetical protein BKA93DRAFT_760034 [Sparassis latifolia]